MTIQRFSCWIVFFCKVSQFSSPLTSHFPRFALIVLRLTLDFFFALLLRLLCVFFFSNFRSWSLLTCEMVQNPTKTLKLFKIISTPIFATTFIYFTHFLFKEVSYWKQERSYKEKWNSSLVYEILDDLLSVGGFWWGIIIEVAFYKHLLLLRSKQASLYPSASSIPHLKFQNSVSCSVELIIIAMWSSVGRWRTSCITSVFKIVIRLTLETIAPNQFSFLLLKVLMSKCNNQVTRGTAQ